MPPRIDLELGGAAWESIRRDTEDAARLARAIDWLGLAWINAAVVVDDMRIPVLRAAFEVLFNEGDSEQLARSLGDLLEPDSEPKPREWATLAGKPRRGLLTDIAWWFIRFSFLRNALLHRDPVGVGAEDVRRHVDHAEAYLRRAIKETIAADGHDEIRRDAAWRELYRQALKRLGPAS
jgi:hypothetical protein